MLKRCCSFINPEKQRLTGQHLALLHQLGAAVWYYRCIYESAEAIHVTVVMDQSVELVLPSAPGPLQEVLCSVPSSQEQVNEQMEHFGDAERHVPLKSFFASGTKYSENGVGQQVAGNNGQAMFIG